MQKVGYRFVVLPHCSHALHKKSVQQVTVHWKQTKPMHTPKHRFPLQITPISVENVKMDHRIVGYPELEETYKDHWSPACGPAQDTPVVTPWVWEHCPPTVPCLNSGRLGAVSWGACSRAHLHAIKVSNIPLSFHSNGTQQRDLWNLKPCSMEENLNHRAHRWAISAPSFQPKKTAFLFGRKLEIFI